MFEDTIIQRRKPFFSFSAGKIGVALIFFFVLPAIVQICISNVCQYSVASLGLSYFMNSNPLSNQVYAYNLFTYLYIAFHLFISYTLSCIAHHYINDVFSAKARDFFSLTKGKVFFMGFFFLVLPSLTTKCIHPICEYKFIPLIYSRFLYPYMADIMTYYKFDFMSNLFMVGELFVLYLVSCVMFRTKFAGEYEEDDDQSLSDKLFK